MNAKEEATELIQKYFDLTDHMNWAQAKECALICIEKIMFLHKGKFACENEMQNESFWDEVKSELEKL